MTINIHLSRLAILPLFLALASGLHAQWYQLGDTIYSINSTEKTGSAVALSADAQTVIVGGEHSDINGIRSGVARVFQWDGSSMWLQKGADLLGENTEERFGHSVCISDDGDVIAIGASNIAGGSAEPGYVKVFSWNGSAWVQMGSTLVGEANGNQSGYAVSMDDNGTVVAISAIGAGNVKVYEWNGADWFQKGSTISGTASDWFGNSLALTGDGDNLIVGAKFANLYIGSVKVYAWNGSSWVQKGQTINGQTNYDQAGFDVAISDNGEIIGVGSVECCNANSKEGVVKVYEFNGSTWDQKGSEMRGLDIGDHFGSRISMNSAGNRIAAADLTVGATAYDWDGNDWYISGGWITGGALDTGLEFDVSLSASGKELAFGDVTSMNSLGYSGTTRVYALDGEVGLAKHDPTGTFELFPNPITQGEIVNLKIQVRAPIFLDINIIDITGKVVKIIGSKLLSTGENNISIDSEGLETGIYIVRTSTNSGEHRLTEKIVIK